MMPSLVEEDGKNGRVEHNANQQAHFNGNAQFGMTTQSLEIAVRKKKFRRSFFCCKF
jgi:hypothetical protein